MTAQTRVGLMVGMNNGGDECCCDDAGLTMLTSRDFRGLVNRRFLANLLPQPGRITMRLGDRPPNFTLPDSALHPVRLSDYRQQQPVLLAFTRIFTEKQYCPFCFPHIQALNAAYASFQDRGVAVLMITSTPVEQSRVIQRDLALKFPLLSDPQCQVFRQYGVGQAIGAPLPAQFLLDRTGRLRFQHLFSFLSHNADIGTLLQHCNNLS